MRLKIVERPIAIGNHVNPALRADQNGNIRRLVSRPQGRIRRFKYLGGVVEEPAHNSLIAPVGKCVSASGLLCAASSHDFPAGLL